MIYKSNLTAPDLRPFFKLHSPPQLIMGHEAPSDPDFEPGCTWWTDDEAAILYNVARQVGGCWLDLGARLGWTTSHVAMGIRDSSESGACWAVDRAFDDDVFVGRFQRNMNQLSELINVSECSLDGESVQQELSAWEEIGEDFDGFVIDADHDDPQPLLDAQGCHRIAKPDAVILMHDFMGRPIQDGVRWLMENGWRCRIYDTPNGVALLWRTSGPSMGRSSYGPMAEFKPPFHVPDPAIDWAEIRRRIARDEGFQYEKTE